MGEWTTERFKTTMLSGDYVEIMGNKEQQLSSTAQASRNPNLKQTWWRSSLLYAGHSLWPKIESSGIWDNGTAQMISIVKKK